MSTATWAIALLTFAQLVRANRPPNEEREFLLKFAEQHLAAAERTRFVAMVERELASLNPATFARYHLRPSEFEAYRKARAVSQS